MPNEPALWKQVNSTQVYAIYRWEKNTLVVNYRGPSRKDETAKTYNIVLKRQQNKTHIHTHKNKKN